MISAGLQVVTIAGWAKPEYIDAANWRVTRCPCEKCMLALITIEETWNLCCMITVGPASDVEAEAVNTLLRLKAEWSLSHPDRYSTHRVEGPK